MNKLRDKASPEADKHILVGRKAHEADISIYTLYIILSYIIYYILNIKYYILYIIYYLLFIIYYIFYIIYYIL